MQTLARDGLSATQVLALLNADDAVITAGADLLDTSDRVIADLTPDLAAASVSRSNYAAVHGTATFTLSRALVWDRDRVRLHQTWSSPVLGLTARFNRGVFIPRRPADTLGQGLVTYTVQARDKLDLLLDPVGDTYEVVANGTRTYLQAVREAITAAGVGGAVLLDSSADTVVVPSTMVWPLVPVPQAAPGSLAGAAGTTTWLAIVNALLAAVGYRGLWADENGAYRSEPYVAPSARASEYRLDRDDIRTANLSGVHTRTQASDVPNRWVFVRRGMDVAPPAGAGLYVVPNTTGLPTRTVVVELDAPDQASLVAQGDARVAADRQVAVVLEGASAPSPVAGHFDVLTYADAELGADRKVLARSWTDPDLFRAADMRWVLEEVA